MIDQELLRIAMNKVIVGYNYKGVHYKDWEDFKKVVTEKEGVEVYLKIAKWRVPEIAVRYKELFKLEQEIMAIFEEPSEGVKTNL
jgi:hypothetical protein